jgi:hypothetical protein
VSSPEKKTGLYRKKKRKLGGVGISNPNVQNAALTLSSMTFFRDISEECPSPFGKPLSRIGYHLDVSSPEASSRLSNLERKHPVSQ